MQWSRIRRTSTSGLEVADIAAKNIKGITIEINGDVTKLDRALGQVDKDLNTTQKNLKEVERLLKLDPKNVELLDQKQRLLAQGVELTSKKYDTLKKTLENATASNVRFDQWEKAQASLQGQITKTENALSKLYDEQKRMQDLNFAPDSTQMQALQQEIDETREKSEALRQKMAETFEELGRPISIDQYDALQRELVQAKDDMEKATKAANDFEAGTDIMGAGAEDASGVIGKLNSLLGGSGGGMVVAAAAGAAAIKLAAEAIKALADWTAEAIKESSAFADEMLTLSQQTGFDTDFLQGLDYASGLVDVSTESIISSMRKLKQNLASDSSSVKEAFDRLNIIPEQLTASGASMEEIFHVVVSALSGVDNELERDQLAMQLFGRSADDLAGVIDDGGESLYNYIQAAKDAGYVMSGEELTALGQVDDAFYKLDKAMELAKKRVAIELAPSIIELTDRILDLIETADWDSFGHSMNIVFSSAIPLIIDMAHAIRETIEAVANLIEMFDKLKVSDPHNLGKIATAEHGSSYVAAARGYATGGVFEPNNPMIIGIGDNRTEREVVTPESLIRRVVREEAGGSGGNFTAVIEFSGTDDQIIRALAPRIRAYDERLGVTL